MLKEIWLILLICIFLIHIYYHRSCLPNGAWSNTQEIIWKIGPAVREGSAIRAVWLWLSNVTLIEIRPPRCADTSNSRKGFLKRYTRGYHKRFSGSPEGDIIEVLDRFKGRFRQLLVLYWHDAKRFNSYIKSLYLF